MIIYTIDHLIWCDFTLGVVKERIPLLHNDRVIESQLILRRLIIMDLFAGLSSIAVNLLMSLVTENFIKKFVYRGLNWAAERYGNDVTQDMVEDVAQAWKIEDR